MSKEMIKALEEIIAAEKSMKTKFERLAEQASTPEMRALFQSLAQEEAGHEKELTERLIALRLIGE